MRPIRVLLAVVVTLAVVACSGGAAPGASTETLAASSPGATAAPDTSASAPSDAPASESPSQAATTVIPADCAEGFAAYLAAIEPLVATFDPAKDKLADLYAAQDAAREKSMELLDANDSRAPYSCEEVGLAWAYFDSNTPWDAVMVVAGEAAPGAVGYLTGLRTHAATDGATLADYGIDGCDAAVSGIKQAVRKAKVSGVDKLTFQQGVELVGRYKAYMHDVQDGVCPPDDLGNDEFGFMAPAR
jgi:hypothetical protein